MGASFEKVVVHGISLLGCGCRVSVDPLFPFMSVQGPLYEGFLNAVAP
jgi:hypothetical protein